MTKNSLTGNKLFLIHDFLSASECEKFIAQSENEGYETASIDAGAGAIIRTDIRNNTRLISDDDALAATFFERAKPFLPANWLGWDLIGFNERFRYYRYDVGQTFHTHFDGAFSRSGVEQSHFTFLIYLNADFEGGHTNFYNDEGDLLHSVAPKTGSALVFWHPMLHEGATVNKGRKYVLRTDVMYRWD